MKNLNEQLLKASEKGDVDGVISLLDRGADIEARNNDGDTPLLRACTTNHTKIVELLLNSGADIENRNDEGYTPLLLSSYYGLEEIVELLLDHGADVEAMNDECETSLLLASHYFGYPGTVKLLLGYSADITVIDSVDCMSIEYKCVGVWKEEETQELIINKQPHNIKIFDNKVGFLPHLREKYKDIIELSDMGLL